MVSKKIKMPSKIIKNVLSIFTGRILNSILYFILTMILMKSLSVSNYGTYAYYYSIISFSSFFLTFGVNNTYVTLITHANSIGEEKRYYNGYVTIKLFLTLIITISIISYQLLTNNLVISISLFSGLLFGLFESVKVPLQAKKEFKKIALILPFRNILFITIISFFLLINFLSLSSTIYTLLICNLINLLVFVFFVAKLKFYKVDFFSALEILIESRWLTVRDFCIAIMMQSQIFIMKYYIDKQIIPEEQLGYFSGAFTICMILPLISSSIVNVFLPEMNNYKGKKINNYLNILIKSIPIISVLLIFFNFFSSYFLELFFTNKYSNSIPLLKYLIVAIGLSFYTNLISLLYYNKKRMNLIMKLSIIQLLFDAIIGYILIGKYGALGGVITVITVRFVGLIFVLVNLKKLKRD